MLLNGFVLIESASGAIYARAIFIHMIFQDMCPVGYVRSIPHLSCWFLLCFRILQHPSSLFSRFERCRSLELEVAILKGALAHC